MQQPLDPSTQFLRTTLPAMVTDAELEEFLRIGVPVAVEITLPGGPERSVLLARGGRLVALPPETPAECTFRLSPDTFGELVAGGVSPQRAFFTGRVRIDGHKLVALRVASVLERVFQRAGAAAPVPPPRPAAAGTEEALSDRQREVLELHLDPKHGSAYWLELSRRLGIRARDLRTFADLARLGPFDRVGAAARPWRDLVPRAVLDSGVELILGETGGTTGAPFRSVWSPAEFHRSFVAPLVGELGRRGVGPLRQWLYAGPSGPHIIGRAALALARETSRVDCLGVDVDPRWHRRLSPGSFAASRYTDHIVEQAVALLEVERVDALFTTPAVLERLLPRMGEDGRGGLRLVHLGGQSVSPERAAALRDAFGPGTHVINGYGNSMFGCIVEEPEPVTYAYPGGHHVLRIEHPEAPACHAGLGATGRIVCHRFDDTMLLLNVQERDEADHLGRCFRHPRPQVGTSHLVEGGIY